ncbi:hypothetical protein Ga0100230_019140 [Opitutaceae bacterium TAV3]|nr:hypothetical protein Ga0100230_019140 [Opitutaceae bacterium TAV3]
MDTRIAFTRTVVGKLQSTIISPPPPCAPNGLTSGGSRFPIRQDSLPRVCLYDVLTLTFSRVRGIFVCELRSRWDLGTGRHRRHFLVRLGLGNEIHFREDGLITSGLKNRP